MWMIEEDGANGDCWESEDDGATWANKFTPSEIAKFLLPRAADDGDIWVIEHDEVNDDLELWWWDKSAGAPDKEDSQIEETSNGFLGLPAPSVFIVLIAFASMAIVMNIRRRK